MTTSNDYNFDDNDNNRNNDDNNEVNIDDNDNNKAGEFLFAAWQEDIGPTSTGSGTSR